MKLKELMAAAALLLIGSLSATAQDVMSIHYKNGTTLDVPIDQIDSLTFADHDTAPTQEATLTGSWLWGGHELGYYELLTLNADNTFTGYDYFFTYGFDTWTYGYYFRMGSMLRMQSYGYGYQRHYDWYILELTDNALKLMTRTGPFTYYRLQDTVIHLQTGVPQALDAGDAIVFADGVTVSADADGLLLGLAPGTTYIQKLIGAENKVKAYKVIVE